MSAALQLKSRIEALGGDLRVHHDDIQITTPKGTMTHELREALKAAKLELVKLLSEPKPAPGMTYVNIFDMASDAGRLAPRPGHQHQMPSPPRADHGRGRFKSVPEPDESLDGSHHDVAAAVRAEITRVESEAQRLGWPKWRLWRAEFWPPPRGLAAVMDPR